MSVRDIVYDFWAIKNILLHHRAFAINDSLIVINAFNFFKTFQGKIFKKYNAGMVAPLVILTTN